MTIKELNNSRKQKLSRKAEAIGSNTKNGEIRKGRRRKKEKRKKAKRKEKREETGTGKKKKKKEEKR